MTRVEVVEPKFHFERDLVTAFETEVLTQKKLVEALTEKQD